MEQQLGTEHPDVAQSLNNLAALYYSQGRYSEAEPLYVRSLAIFERWLGQEHPNTAVVRGNLEALRRKLDSGSFRSVWRRLFRQS